MKLLFTLLLLLTSSISLAYNKGIPTHGPDAMDLRYSYSSTQLYVPGLSGNKDVPAPSVAPSPGDTITGRWKECSDGTCTRYFRTDRYQRHDSPVTGEGGTGGDPSAGSGPYEWVPVDWGSQACSLVCIEVEDELRPF